MNLPEANRWCSGQFTATQKVLNTKLLVNFIGERHQIKRHLLLADFKKGTPLNSLR